MRLRSWLEANPRAAWMWRITGACLFVIAFFLPACEMRGSWNGFVVFKGWECAWFALVLPILYRIQRDPGDSGFEVLLLTLSSLVNFAVIALLVSSFSRKAGVLRKVLEIAIPVCMLATWIFFVLDKMRPLPGHYLWIAGALLIIVSNLRDWAKNPSPAHMAHDGANDHILPPDGQP